MPIENDPVLAMVVIIAGPKKIAAAGIAIILPKMTSTNSFVAAVVVPANAISSFDRT